MAENELLPCPFCSEVNFDDIGLKHHLRSGYCEKYNNITLIGNEMGNALDIILGTGEQNNAD